MKRVIKASTDDNVFYWNGVDEVPRDVVKVVIEDGVDTIKSDAFRSRSNLVDVVMPNSVKQIGTRAFEDCANLKHVSFSNSLSFIKPFAFMGCRKLSEVNLPESIEVLGGSAFEGCESITYINIPRNIKELYTSVFRNCINLEKVSISPSVETIGQFAFGNCESLKSVIIPSSVRIIKDWAFENCLNLQYVKISDFTEVENYAFLNCPLLENLGSTTSELTHDLIIDTLENNGIDTTLQNYEVLYCENAGRGYGEVNSFIAEWPGDFLATWAVSHPYQLNDEDPLDAMIDSYETFEYFKDIFEVIKTMKGENMLEYYDDADKDFIVSLTNLDTGEVLINNRDYYDEFIK